MPHDHDYKPKTHTRTQQTNDSFKGTTEKFVILGRKVRDLMKMLLDTVGKKIHVAKAQLKVKLSNTVGDHKNVLKICQ